MKNTELLISARAAAIIPTILCGLETGLKHGMSGVKRFSTFGVVYAVSDVKSRGTFINFKSEKAMMLAKIWVLNHAAQNGLDATAIN